jgi:hypothetical protein
MNTLPPNPQHSRQSFWQIWMPLMGIILLFLGLGALAIVLMAQGSGSANQWAHLSLIWILLPTCLCNIIPLAILMGSVFGAGKAYTALPPLTAKINHALQRLLAAIRRFSDKLAAPFIKVSSTKAGWDATVKRVTQRNNKPK